MINRFLPRSSNALTLVVLTASASLLAAAEPRTGLQTPQLAAAQQYLRGIGALEKGAYPQAATAFGAALENDPDNQEIVRAKGVAEALAEQFPAALRDLERATKLDPRDPEARLWLSAAYRMSGDAGRGASLFLYDSRLPKTYTELIDRMGLDYWTSTQQHRYWDRRTQQNVETNEPQRGAFLEAAQIYAKRHKPSGPVATQLVSQSVEAKLAAGDFAGARPDLLVLLEDRPDDLEVQKKWTVCLLGLKNYSTARAQATYVLGIDPLWTDGYLLRAEAAAHLGDTRRARSDLECARHLDPKRAAVAHGQLQPLLNAKASESAPQDFGQALEAGVPFAELVTQADQLARYFEPRRARYDELWQERLWELADARRTDPKRPERAEMEARYLLHTLSVPRLWNGPRGEPELLRRQSKQDQQREANQILSLCDEALKLDPRYVPAMGTKATLLLDLGNLSGAENMVKQGLALEPDNVTLLELNARCLEAEAVGVAAPTVGLLAGHTDVRYSRRADGVYREETHTGPSAAQRAQASGLIGEATAIRQEGMDSIVHARTVRDQKIPALLDQAQRALDKKDLKSAARLCEQALRLWPDNPKAQELFAKVLGAEGRLADQRIYAQFSQSIPNTSAAEELKQAWADIERTAFAAAATSLERGTSVDPVDSRLLAYRSVISEANGKLQQAEHYREGALSLEEARARAEGTSYEPQAKGPLDPDAIGLALLLKERLAAGQLTNNPEHALRLEREVCALEQRLPKGSIYRLEPSAMLPDPNTPTGHIQTAPSLVELFAWAHLHAAQALLALQRVAEAKPELDIVHAYQNEWPMTVEGRHTLDPVAGWACLESTKLALAQKQWDEVQFLLTNCQGGGTRELEEAKGRLADEFYRERREQADAVAARQNAEALRQANEWQRLKASRYQAPIANPAYGPQSAVRARQ